MNHLTRREFVKGSGVYILKLGHTIILGVLAILSFYIIKSFANITVAGWLALGLIGLVFVIFYIMALIIEKIVGKYELKYGAEAKANIDALSVTAEALMVGIFSAMAAKAVYQDRPDNVVMWAVLLAMSLWRIFKGTKQKLLNG